MQFLKANTAVDVRIGPFVDVGDGFTPETGITLGAADEAELLKHNGAATVDISSNTWAAVTSCDGWYDLTLTATDTNTEGQLTVVVQDDSVCLPVFGNFMVLAEAAFDSLFTAKDTGYMDINVKAVSEDTTAADNLELACDNYSATRGLTGTALPAAAADAAGGVPISDAGGLDLDGMNTNVSSILTDTGTDGVVVAAGSKSGYSLAADQSGVTIGTVSTLTGHTAQTGDTYGALPTNFSDLSITVTTGRVDVAAVGGTSQTANDNGADINAILVDTNEIQGKLPSKSYLSGSTDADGGIDATEAAVINGEVDTALSDIHLDDLAVRGNTAQAGAAGTITLDASASATNNLYQGQWIVLTSGTGAGQSRRIVSYVGATKVATVDSNWATNPDNTSVFVIYGNYTEAMRGTDSAALASVCTEGRLSELDAGNIPSDVDAILADTGTDGVVVAAGSKTGYSLAADQSAVTVGTVTTLTGHTAQTGDTYGALPTNFSDLSITVTTGRVDVESIEGVNATDQINTEADTALTDYDPPTKAEMDTAHALLATPAQVNTQVLDVLNTDTFAEPGQEAPAATATLITKIGYLYKLLRNKIETTSTTISIYDDAGTTVDQKSTISDNGTTFTRGEFASGP